MAEIEIGLAPPVRASKTQVDRAGRELADFVRPRGKDRVSRPAAEEARRLVELVEIVVWWRREHAKPLSRVAASLRYYAAEHGSPIVAQRLKKADSINSKLIRQASMRLSQMADIGGVRAVLPDLDAVQKVAAQLKRNWTIVGTSDYIARPKADGYRAIHLINRHRGRLIEVQLRTPRQDSWANAVERDGRLYAENLKWGSGPDELTEYYKVVGELLAIADAGGKPKAGLAAEAVRLQGAAIRLRRRRSQFK